MVLLQSEQAKLDSKAPDFSLPGTDQKIHQLSETQGTVTLIIFMCNHCPYVKAVLDRIIALAHSFKDQPLAMFAINSNDAENYPEDSFDAMKQLILEKKLPFPYLYDESQDIAKAYGAVCTPDFFLYDTDHSLKYRGRLDDNWEDPSSVSQEDLKEAIQALLNHKPVSHQQIPSMGCSIKWKR